MPTIEESLRATKMFSGVSAPDMKDLLDLCVRKELEPNSFVLTEGKPVERLCVLESGRVGLQMDLERPDGSSTGPTTVHSVEVGEAFGWSALVPPYLSTLTGIAVEPSTVIAIDAGQLRAALDSHHSMGYQVMSNIAILIAERLHDTREALAYHRSWVEYMERQSD